jgi:hypothetical protein
MSKHENPAQTSGRNSTARRVVGYIGGGEGDVQREKA